MSPLTATQFGLPGSDHRWDDFSPDGRQARHGMYLRYRRALEPHLTDSNEVAREAAVVLADFLDTLIAQHDTGDHLRDVAHAYCTFTQCRDIFDIAPRGSAEDWDHIAQRMATLSEPLTGWTQVLATGVVEGKVAARRQVISLVEQAEALAGPESRFLALVDEAREAGFATAGLVAAAGEARAAAAGVADWLRSDYLPHAEEGDGVGEERYLRAAEEFLGMVLDPAETYEWAWAEIARIQAEMVQVAATIDPAATLAEVIAVLDTDPARCVAVEGFTGFVQERLDRAVADLAGSHFDVPDEIRPLTVSLAPPGGSLGAWYVNPSADWQRPGSVWYALGERRSIPVWQEVSTAYHEGFPGHHLQVATAMYQSDRLSEAHRLLIWYSGYGEGWALYAERLMDELGYLDKPDYRLGLLASQLLRAVRVVVDIGSHLDLPIPRGAPLFGGERWSFDRAVAYLVSVAAQPPDIARSEVTRYLGWPAQAISYAVGEREFLDIRQKLKDRDPDLDMKEFHRRVLEGGELRLDHLRRRLLG